jgi:DMSO/TMAO reductase YedYZ molybdopterin-dependent catalytic subunit
MMDVTQITRHDCVEGWSAIVQWQGVRVADVVAMARPSTRARYVVFHSFDRDANGTPYYESLSLEQAAHPQTLLALRQNGKDIEADHGAPVRLTVPTQLGYKSAKWVKRVQIVDSLAAIFGGKGGYWEDQGYEWYAGI